MVTRDANVAADTADITGRFPIASDWLLVSQEMIDQFGRATLDPDPMHQDPEWARDHSPFRGTIAYGFMAGALLSHLFKSARTGSAEGPPIRSGFLRLNYGFDRLRLVRPIPAGSRIRGHFSVLNGSGRTRTGHAILRLSCRIEVEGQQTPALVGEWLTVAVPSSRGPEEPEEPQENDENAS